MEHSTLLSSWQEDLITARFCFGEELPGRWSDEAAAQESVLTAYEYVTRADQRPQGVTRLAAKMAAA